jgi:hypothetical protein
MTGPRGVRISDTRDAATAELTEGDPGYLSFDLVDILRALGERARESSWTVENLDCFGESAEELDRLAESGRAIEGASLVRIAERLTQVIDGDFAGVDSSANQPWVIVRAVDSSWWEVWTDDDSALAAITARFKAVTPLDEYTA